MGRIVIYVAIPLVISTLLVPFSPAQTQTRNPNASAFSSITGRIIVPVAAFEGMFEVRLVQNLEQPVQAMVADSLGRFRFTGLARGTYYILVNIDGFEDVRQRVDVGSGDTIVNIILDFKEERIVKPPTDFSGEDLDVIDVTELTKSYPSQVVDGLRSASRDFSNGNYLKAMAVLEGLVDETPDLYQGHRLLGMVYQKLGRYRDAESEYRTAADLRQQSAAPWINLGSLYIQEAEANSKRGSALVRTILNEALASLNEAVRLKPDAPFAYYLLGVTYYRTAFYEEAEDQLKHALDLAPSFLDARLALANVYVRMREWMNAIAQLDAYLEGNPKSEIRQQVEETRAQILARAQAQLR
jgi:Flp pilus assembly protein TadD